MFFIGVIVQPLFSVLSRLDNVDIDVAVENLRENQARWKQLIVDYDLEAAAEKEASAEAELEAQSSAELEAQSSAEAEAEVEAGVGAGAEAETEVRSGGDEVTPGGGSGPEANLQEEDHRPEEGEAAGADLDK